MNNNLKKKSKKRAFTLIELIVVIAILGVLAAILVPTMTNLITEARTQTAVANARTVYGVASAEASFALASGVGIAAASGEDAYSSEDESGFGKDVAVQAGQMDGKFTITVNDEHNVTSVTFEDANGITGTYPTT